MARLGFAIDNRACIGCHACTVACKAEHETPLGVNRTWVKYIEKGEFPNTRRSFQVTRCNHCEDAPCVEICPVTSLFHRPDGIVDFDPTRCIACKACMNACPYDALHLDPATQTAAKCNYCTHRVDRGLEPACVVVCPVEAIVSGDLDDPESRISRLDRLQRVQYPKVEKGTRPKLFYVGGETAGLDPAAAPPREDYLWSTNLPVISPADLAAAAGESEDESRARRTYDQRSRPAPWGWMVSAYITTKAVAAGVVLAALLMFALAGVLPGVPAVFHSHALPTPTLLVALLFLGVTGALLVADLKRPRRFLYVLLRPQWRSWLVRGAYLITLFALVVPLCWLLSVAGASRAVQGVAAAVAALSAVTVAGYTGLLLAQAKGRDYWQNPLLTYGMVVDAVVAGVAALALLGLGGDAWLATLLLAVGTGKLGLLTLAEHLPRHATRNAELAARLMLRGPFAAWFWGGAVAVGLLLPAILLALALPQAAAIALLGGIAAKNHVLVQAPQRVPLS